ncbi:YifB family Mg chelatase-like AAA ATPase [Porphyromonas sp.]|uniref:YifB family Mg chelatase-like AAA ATPase n=1 Tax=Porphyromonas sp. TaxID=1924944 RepID=UPI003A8EAD8A
MSKLVKTYSSALVSLDALLVTVELSVSKGFNISMVGLPDAAVRESLSRVYTACDSSDAHPKTHNTVINLSPGDVRKEGTVFDLPIAVALLAANEVIPEEPLANFVMAGELSLDGTLQPVKGILPMAIMAREQKFKGVIVPKENAREAAVVNDLEVYGVESLREVIDFLAGRAKLEPTVVNTREEFAQQQCFSSVDFSEVKGQPALVRAMEVAAAGGHNIIMIGSPGSGKSMVAKRLPTILPPLTLHEALETTKIYSVAGALKGGVSLMKSRPFRSPHHTISNVALVGGGTTPRPGEVSLAHNGVLFLDELAEFNRVALELLRQPLEDRTITISRAKATFSYPASFMLVAAMNPCPCGYYNDPNRECTCPPGAPAKYLQKLSGPLLDRIDIQIETRPVDFDALSDRRPSESSAAIRERVIKAREIQLQRFAPYPGIHCNAQMTPRLMKQFAYVEGDAMKILRQAMIQRDLSARAYDRILKVARTIADLDGSDQISLKHISEAINYRNLDRSSWGIVSV